MSTVDAPLGFVLGRPLVVGDSPPEPLKPLTVPLFDRLRGPKTFLERSPRCLEPGDSNARYLNRGRLSIVERYQATARLVPERESHTAKALAQRQAGDIPELRMIAQHVR
jgi:hypothetical protein